MQIQRNSLGFKVTIYNTLQLHQTFPYIYKTFSSLYLNYDITCIIVLENNNKNFKKNTYNEGCPLEPYIKAFITTIVEGNGRYKCIFFKIILIW